MCIIKGVCKQMLVVCLQVFDFNRWETHRSTSRYLRHMQGLPTSRLVRGLAGPLLYVLGVATAVCAYEYARQASRLRGSMYVAGGKTAQTRQERRVGPTSRQQAGRGGVEEQLHGIWLSMIFKARVLGSLCVGLIYG